MAWHAKRASGIGLKIGAFYGWHGAGCWERVFDMLTSDEIEELDERDADEPVGKDGDALPDDELELPPALIGVPFN